VVVLEVLQSQIARCLNGGSGGGRLLVLVVEVEDQETHLLCLLHKEIMVEQVVTPYLSNGAWRRWWSNCCRCKWKSSGAGRGGAGATSSISTAPVSRAGWGWRKWWWNWLGFQVDLVAEVQEQQVLLLFARNTRYYQILVEVVAEVLIMLHLEIQLELQLAVQE
jgi:hypothetical protein